MWKILKSSNGKNLVEPNKNENFVAKTYTFDITKCDEIFDLLVIDGHIIVPKGLKTPHQNIKEIKVFVSTIISWVIRLRNVFFLGIQFRNIWKRKDSNWARSQRQWWRWTLTQCRLRTLTMLSLWRSWWSKPLRATTWRLARLSKSLLLLILTRRQYTPRLKRGWTIF